MVPAPKRRRSARPRLELLEIRALLSVDAVPALPLSASPERLLVQVADSGRAPGPAAYGLFGPGVEAVGGGLFSVELGAGDTLAAAAARFAAQPGISYAVPDHVIEAFLAPNDPEYPQQYGLDNATGTGIDAARAWDVSTGNSSTIEAVTDTGVDYTHPDLYLNIALNAGEIPASIKSRLVQTDGNNVMDFRDLNSLNAAGLPVLDASGNKVNAWATHDYNNSGYIDGGDLLLDPTWNDGVDKDHNGYAADLIGWNFVTDTNNPIDDHGHGTHVSGTIGAMSNNGVGVSGVVWNAHILAMKFLDATGEGSTADGVRAIRYAADMGAKAINASWGYQAAEGETDPALSAAITYAGSLGSVFIAAAGNASVNNDTNQFIPASFRLPNQIVVAASDQQGNLAGFSNYGPTTVDVAAPGVSILSTTPWGHYGQLSGTSMAAPHVTGIIGLLAGVHPDWTAQQLVQRVVATAKPLPGLTGKVITGGLADAGNALAVPPPPPVASSVAVNAGGGAAGSFAADTGFSGGLTYSVPRPVDTSGVTDPAPQGVYQSERYGDFTYTVPGLVAGNHYTVRLHFAEIYSTAPNQRIFNVAVNGARAVTNLDVFAAAGARDKAVMRSVDATADSSGRITVAFQSVVDNAICSGIEVVGTVAPPATTSVGTNAGGGAAGSFAADTGFSGGLTYSVPRPVDTSGVTDPAPQGVYQSERYGDFTYTVPGLVAGNHYTVRLHFAEIYSTAPNQRIFNVAVNGARAVTNLDVFAAAGARDKAVMRSVDATADSSGRITVAFQSVVDNAICSGIEVIG